MTKHDLLDRLLTVETADEIMELCDSVVAEFDGTDFMIRIVHVLIESCTDRIGSYSGMIFRYPVEPKVSEWNTRLERLKETRSKLEQVAPTLVMS